MYSASEIKTGFSGLLGISNPINPKYPRVPSDLQNSDSGLFYNEDFHPITNIENIYNSVEYLYRDAAEYTVGTYASGTIVKNGHFVYSSLEDDNVEEPSINATSWEWTTYTQIRSMIERASVTVVRSFLQEMKLIGTSKGLFNDTRIFDRSGKYSDEVVKRGAFVGLRVATHTAVGLQLLVSKLGIQLTTAQDTLVIYCYHSSKSTPIWTKTLTDIESREFNWFPIDEEMDSHGSVDAGGYFYIGYYDEDVTGNAINRKYDFSRVPCKGCISQTYDYISYKQWSKYYNIRPFYVLDINDERTLFDTEDVVEEIDNNFGLNLELTVRCDITDFLIKHKFLFADALGTQFSCDVMKSIETSTRGNNITDRLREQASMELRGAVNDLGYMQNVNKVIKSINIDFNNLNSPCFGMSRKGIKYGSV